MAYNCLVSNIQGKFQAGREIRALPPLVRREIRPPKRRPPQASDRRANARNVPAMMYKIALERIEESRRRQPDSSFADSLQFLPQFRVRVEGANAAGSNESLRRGQQCRAAALKKQRLSRDANVVRIRTPRASRSCARRVDMETSPHPRQR